MNFYALKVAKFVFDDFRYPKALDFLGRSDRSEAVTRLPLKSRN